MNSSRLLLSGALAIALAAPLAAGAQSTPAAPLAAPFGNGPQHHGHGMMRALRDLNLSDQQRSQIQQLEQQYRQQYPKGSAPNPQARKDLRDKIFATLTPEQQAQVKQRLAQMRAEHAQQNTAPNGTAPAITPVPPSSPNAR